MSRVVVFGDSFCAEKNATGESKDYAWTKLLGKKYDCPVIYHSDNGSSLDYTAVKFFEYLESDYKEDDIIVVVLTSMYRLPIVHEDYSPKWAAVTKFAIEDPSFVQRINNPVFTRYIEDIRPYFQIWDSYFNPKAFESLCLYLSKTIESLPNNKLVVSAFPDSENGKIRAACHPSGFMGNISKMEYVETEPFRIIGTRSLDNRMNHMSEENHFIFADYAYKCLEGNYSPIKYSDYKSQFLETGNE